MGRIGGLKWIVVCLLLLPPMGCSQQGINRSNLSGDVPVVRVRLLQSQSQVMVAASESPYIRASSETEGRTVNFPRGTAVPVALSPAGWRISGATIGHGELLIQPARDGTVSVNGQPYRGRYRLVPIGNNKFDVVNDVDIDGYLKGVVAKELLWNWHPEAYRAQAIVARTYALYEWKTAGSGRHWDLHPDVRSQVYGGISAESEKSREAVDYTSGVVVTYGPAGNEKIFKTYFSSCCGGISQSAADAFGDLYIEPLSDQNNGATCSMSPRFNWGPVTIKKDELTRRFRAYGLRRGKPEKDMAQVARIDIQATNRWGRPTRFVVTDIRGAKYSWSGEEIRWAVNTDAAGGTTLYSSFFKILDGGETISFVEGHGWGHGVGMCQWCAQRRAEEGMRHEDIVLAAFQRAKLVRAY